MQYKFMTAADVRALDSPLDSPESFAIKLDAVLFSPAQRTIKVDHRNEQLKAKWIVEVSLLSISVSSSTFSRTPFTRW